MQLVIVESPTKSKTISRFLSKDFLVASSYGHIRDLPPKRLGIDIQNNFEPEYEIPLKAKPKVKELKAQASKAQDVILATDEDREGESIAFHLSEILGLKKPKRIVFHEITKKAIEAALTQPRTLNMDMVFAQQARRLLDRLVGYKLSPFLWKKVMRGLSAGRVQSVATRLVCEREAERETFKSQEYWNIAVKLLKIKNQISNIKNNEVEAVLAEKEGRQIDKLEIKHKQETEDILKELDGATYQVANIESKEERRHPFPPFITSSLQRTAWAYFKFSAKKTMTIAQALYERGLITYHRTDSLNLSQDSQAIAREFIAKNYGSNYLPETTRAYRTKSKTAQEAHEAIRPTNPQMQTVPLKGAVNKDLAKLYTLIWQRFIASQMQSAIFNSVAVRVATNTKERYIFQANGQTMRFDGFLRTYPIKYQENELPELSIDEMLELKEILPSQHFTQPPARYSEATLIKKLEKEEIGRPSTYAMIIDTIQQRGYVEKDENKKLKPTKIGNIVNDILVKNFPQVVDLTFTAKMEKELDEISEGKDTWQKTLKDFYLPFEKNLKEKEQTVVKKDLTEKTDEKCPKCQSDLVIRMGRFGRFFACSAFPKCKFTKPLPRQTIGIECPKCSQGEIVEKHTKRKKIFYGCVNWPKCDFAMWDKPIDKVCPLCRSLLTIKKDKEICPNKECQASQRLEKKYGKANFESKT